MNGDRNVYINNGDRHWLSTDGDESCDEVDSDEGNGERKLDACLRAAAILLYRSSRVRKIP